MHKVVVSGIGLVTPLGKSWNAFQDHLLSGDSAIKHVTLDYAQRSLSAPLAQVLDFSTEIDLPAFKISAWDRASQFAVFSARNALIDADLRGEDFDSLIVGVSTTSVEVMDDSYRRIMLGNGRVPPLSIPKSMPNAPAAAICIDLGIEAPSYSVAAACSSANQAIINSAQLIRSGVAKRVLCGATEASLQFSNVSAWSGMRVVANDTCRPFCKTRSGLALGEGAAFFVLEEKETAKARGAHIWAEISGWGVSSDAHSITTPCVDGVTKSIVSALTHSQIGANQIDYINAHGTGTPLNDVTESIAIRRALGAEAERIPVSSTKSLHGHLLGASGGIELAATIASIQCETIAPTVNWVERDGDIDINVVKNTPISAKINHALTASYAFGGHNTVLAISAI